MTCMGFCCTSLLQMLVSSRCRCLRRVMLSMGPGRVAALGSPPLPTGKMLTTSCFSCRPDLLDPALLRPGRIDVMLYVGVAEDAASKLKVLQALTRKFSMGSAVNLTAVASKCPVTLKGADMYALCASEWMKGLHRTVAQVWQHGVWLLNNAKKWCSTCIRELPGLLSSLP